MTRDVETRRSFLMVGFTKSEKEELRAYAILTGRAMSAIVRDATFDAIRKDGMLENCDRDGQIASSN